jgi:hypothetical protein
VRDGSTALERRVLVPLRITAEALIVGLFPQYGYIGPGDTLALTFYATGSGMTNRDVFFRTYRPDVATVSADGGVVGVTAGSAVISAIAHRDTTLRATSVVVVRNR